MSTVRIAYSRSKCCYASVRCQSSSGLLHSRAAADAQAPCCLCTVLPTVVLQAAHTGVTSDHLWAVAPLVWSMQVVVARCTVLFVYRVPCSKGKQFIVLWVFSFCCCYLVVALGSQVLLHWHRQQQSATSVLPSSGKQVWNNCVHLLYCMRSWCAACRCCTRRRSLRQSR